MSWFMKGVSGTVILIIALVWAVLCLSDGKILPLPESVMYTGLVLFAGEKGIDFIIARWGKGNATTNGS